MEQCFTDNQKTILSLDFDRNSTCMQTCSYCYVDNMERIYPAYKAKIERNTKKLTENPVAFAENLNEDYKKKKKSKAKRYEGLNKLPVRIYGSGDFKPVHMLTLKGLDFKFFMISKNLTTPTLRSKVEELRGIENLTSLVLSFDNANIMTNYNAVKQHYGKSKIKFAFTGLPDSFKDWKDMGYKFDVFFNISHKKEHVAQAKTFKERCPADTSELALQKACTKCSKCWRS